MFEAAQNLLALLLQAFSRKDLVGLGLSRKALASVGVRPLALAVVLWIYISLLSLAVVRWTIV